eukprot:TRINITY_DN22976_c0_g1_i1.p1 TRINITY_DN22976_c0_g1~~TRINITY_DN22976_c0_g1_i1.p1  ORF type:complete len:334 (-),score=93.20 TRINITY_DN22976_c0_g1_i1:81-1082(-)
MQAVVVQEDGGVRVEEGVPMPELRPGDALVEVHATALNRADLLQRKGLYPPPAGESSIMGLELSGVVHSLHPDTKETDAVKIGSRVCALLPGGGYAKYCRVPIDMCIPIPEFLTFEQAAAFPEAWMTAYQALRWVADVDSMAVDWILIHAGASGVGVAATQLIKHMKPGVKVIATAGSAEKLSFCKGVGADHAVNYKEEDFHQAVMGLTGNAGVNVVIDFVGASYWTKNIDCLALDGRMVILGLMGGREAEHTNLGAILKKRLRIQGTTLRTRPAEYKVKLGQEMSSFALPRLESGAMRIVVDKVFTLSEVASAQQYMMDNKNMGKIVMKVQE